MTPTERLEAAAGLLEARAMRSQRWGASRWRMLSQDGMVEGRLARQRAVEDRAAAALLRSVANDADLAPLIVEAALSLAGSVGVSDD